MNSDYFKQQISRKLGNIGTFTYYMCKVNARILE